MVHSLRRYLGIVPAMLIAALSLGKANAQPPVPYVPPETLDQRRQVSLTELRFCVWSDSPLKDFEIRLATEIANALLLEGIVHEIVRPAATNDADFWEIVYTALTNDCEALMGYILVPEQLPVWMAASRPYYSARTVLAVTSENVESLADVPRDQFVGALLSTFGDFQLINYLQTLPENQRWRRLPFDSPERLLARLEDGTIGAALIPEPALYGVLRAHPEPNSVFVASAAPLSIAPTLFSVGMRSSEASLRSIIDDAIVALIQNGTIQEVIEELGLGGEPGSAGR